MPELWIDHQKVQVEEGTSVLEAARKAGIDIPTLCYLKDLNAPAACRRNSLILLLVTLVGRGLSLALPEGCWKLL